MRIIMQGQYSSAGFLAAQQGIAQHFHHIGGHPEQPSAGDGGRAQHGQAEMPHMTTVACEARGAEAAPQAAPNGHPLQYHIGQGYQVSRV